MIAVSAYNKETAINTEQTLDTSLLVDLNDVIDIEPRREDNAEELTGKEEADEIYDLGHVSKWTANFPKAQPQHFAFLLAFGLGSVAAAAAGAGYEHTVTPIDGDEDEARSLPSFTAGQRYGDTVLKRRFASMFVDSVQARFAADDWVQIRGDVKGDREKDRQRRGGKHYGKRRCELPEPGRERGSRARTLRPGSITCSASGSSSPPGSGPRSHTRPYRTRRRP